MAEPVKKANVEDDPELRARVIKRLLAIAAGAALGGAAMRTGIGVLRNANPTYTPPEPVKPIIVDMPYETDVPIEKPIPVDLKRQKPASETPRWMKFIPGGDWFWQKAVPEYRSPLGGPNAKEPTDVPLMAAVGLPLGAASGVGGFYAADKLLRSIDRRRAQNRLEEAQQEYRQEIIKRIAKSRLPAKYAVDSSKSPDANIERIKAALDKAFKLVKKADDGNQGQKTVMSLLFPGLWMGKQMALANMGLVGALAGLGGYAGYNWARNPEVVAKLRNQIRDIDRANAEHATPPLIARMVPVPRRTEQVF